MLATSLRLSPGLCGGFLASLRRLAKRRTGHAAKADIAVGASETFRQIDLLSPTDSRKNCAFSQSSGRRLGRFDRYTNALTLFQAIWIRFAPIASQTASSLRASGK
jgi:hypothetical protein